MIFIKKVNKEKYEINLFMNNYAMRIINTLTHNPPKILNRWKFRTGFKF